MVVHVCIQLGLHVLVGWRPNRRSDGRRRAGRRVNGIVILYLLLMIQGLLDCVGRYFGLWLAQLGLLLLVHVVLLIDRVRLLAAQRLIMQIDHLMRIGNLRLRHLFR